MDNFSKMVNDKEYKKALRAKVKELKAQGLSVQEVMHHSAIYNLKTQAVMRKLDGKGFLDTDEVEREAKQKANLLMYQGLSYATCTLLGKHGYSSAQDCAHLCEPVLETSHGAIVAKEYSNQRFSNRLPLKIVNEVRAWLGAEPYVIPKRKISTAELVRAARTLSQAGFDVRDASSEIEARLAAERSLAVEAKQAILPAPARPCKPT